MHPLSSYSCCILRRNPEIDQCRAPRRKSETESQASWAQGTEEARPLLGRQSPGPVHVGDTFIDFSGKFRRFSVSAAQVMEPVLECSMHAVFVQ